MNANLTATARKIAKTGSVSMVQIQTLRSYAPADVAAALTTAGLSEEHTEQLLFGNQLYYVYGPSAK
jgi:hypothetical protein